MAVISLTASPSSLTLGNSSTITINNAPSTPYIYTIKEDDNLLFKTTKTSFRYTPITTGTHIIKVEYSGGSTLSKSISVSSSSSKKNAIINRFVDVANPFEHNYKKFYDSSFYYDFCTSYNNNATFTVSSNKLTLNSRRNFGSYQPISHSNYYKFEYDVYSPNTNRRYLFFCGNGQNQSDNLIFNTYIRFGTDISNSYLYKRTSSGETALGSYSNSYAGFKGTKHVTFTRNGNTATLQVGDWNSDNIDVTGMGNCFGAFKWNDGRLEFTNIKLTIYNGRINSQITNLAGQSPSIQGKLKDSNNNIIANEIISMNIYDGNQVNNYYSAITDSSGNFSINISAALTASQNAGTLSNLQCIITHKSSYTYNGCISGPHRVVLMFV